MTIDSSKFLNSFLLHESIIMPDSLQSPSSKRREMRAFPAILDKSITKKYKAWFLFIRFGVFKALNIVHKNSFWSYQPHGHILALYEYPCDVVFP